MTPFAECDNVSGREKQIPRYARDDTAGCSRDDAANPVFLCHFAK